MSGTWKYVRPRRACRGAVLTLVFASVLATGAATNSWGGETHRGAADLPRHRAGDGPPSSEPRPDAPEAASPGTEPESGRGSDEGAGRTSGARGPGDATEGAEELVSRSGDRWSAAYSAREYEGLERTLSGEYVGVGISVRRGTDAADSRVIEVARVRPGSPAAEAGVRAGDRLRAVDGERVAALPVTEVVALLRGAASAASQGPGSTVEVELGRDGRQWGEILHRALLADTNVTSDNLSPEVTRIKITRFTEDSGEQVRRAVREVPDGSGILLDLRGNPGGLVDEAADAASALLDGGLVATYDVNGTQRALYAERGGDTEAPVVVLVDGGTMSAAELLTGALQDRGRAVVVGSHTFGKGSVQVPHRMADGSVAELTVGHYRTPAGRSVDRAGLAPDLVVASGTAAESKARTVLGGLAAGS
ncbi:PDZ domain-containing protein [Streptomyces sp. N2-109]|uniref:PDZ domain-containing protein n=1 Tax=Streptomyces gossypii TaxID=2883101 RepID=A0ABT2JTS2_9ACTN|nr:S41 family peptidase [Streptomyces gossypii]MCT2591297.1 PDZ domain-containing protein [Streptomyces gossypii]